MASGDKLRRALIVIAAIVVSGLSFYFGNGLMPSWPLVWFAPLPVLFLALRRPAWLSALMASVALLAGGLNLWDYMRTFERVPVIWFADVGMVAVAFAVGVLLMRALERRGAEWGAWLALPAVWVGFEFVRYLLLWPHGSAGCIAYSQLNFLPFLQFASIAGPWGMGFVLLLFPTGIALAIHRWRPARKQAIRVLGATLGVVAAVLIFGVVRLSIPQPGPMVRVGLIASDANGGAGVEKPGAPTWNLFKNYAEHARQLIALGAHAVVMPEDMGAVLDSDVARTDAIFQPIADGTGATLVVGMARIGVKGRHNEARNYTPHAAARSYHKEHLLPPYETSHFTPGTKRMQFAAPGTGVRQNWGVAICKDMDFTNPSRSYGQNGVGLMLVPAWDFQVDRFWHGHIAVMRAVEDGFSLVRSARGGYLTVANDRGRVLAEVRSDSAPFATLLASVPAGHNATLFLLLGNWAGWCSIVLAMVLLVRLIRLRSRGAA
jgi:apolipoprotein N-acyltransferase